jgi:hypothetical protein
MCVDGLRIRFSKDWLVEMITERERRYSLLFGVVPVFRQRDAGGRFFNFVLLRRTGEKTAISVGFANGEDFDAGIKESCRRNDQCRLVPSPFTGQPAAFVVTEDNMWFRHLERNLLVGIHGAGDTVPSGILIGACSN